MRKIFVYECKRLLGNKFFVGLVAVIVFYGWQVLNRVTILGVSHTAPFSPWSFGDYLGRLLPLLWIGALFFLTFFTSRAERRRARLTAATPVSPARYGLVRCAVALVGTLLLALVVVGQALGFYARLFPGYEWRVLLWPAVLTLLPPLVFAVGSGWLLGRLRAWLLFPWMLLPLALAAAPVPEWLGLLNGSVFAERPLALSEMDPAFSLSVGTVAAQGLLLLAGVAMLLIQPQKK